MASSVSSTSCALSSTASVFESVGTQADRQRRKPLGDGARREFDFTRIGFLVDKNARDYFNRPKLLVGLPNSDKATHIEPYTMKQAHRDVIEPGKDIYYCAEKQLIYPSSAFKAKKAARSKRPPRQSITVAPPEHAIIYNSYFECRCADGYREAILKVSLAAEVIAVLPAGLKDSDEYTSPDHPCDVRIRILSTGKTEILTWWDFETSVRTLRRGDKLWWSPLRRKYFTVQYIKANLRSEADYQQFLASPPKEHKH
jgi:hypothetical protein